MSDLREYRAAAHAQLALGLHVFPADHPDQPRCIGLHDPVTSPCDGIRGKHPAVKFGTWAVTVTPQMIDMAWQKHGGLCNVAIACGPSNLVVLDEDERGAVDAWCSNKGITLPPTYEVTTGRRGGGRHLYYRWDHTVKPIGNSDKAFGGYKINVRGDGGYIIGHGSVHESGVVYTGNSRPITDLPDEVTTLLLDGHNGAPVDSGQFWEPSADPNTEKIPDGKRHTELVAYSGRLRKAGLDYHEAEPTFHQRWLLCEQPAGQIPEARYHSPTCRWPVTWDEARAKLADVYGRYPSGVADLNGDAQPPQDDDEDRIRAFKFPDKHRPTDVGNADRLLAHARGRIRYVRAWGKWIVYQNGRWIIDEKDALVTEIAKGVARRLYRLAAETALTDPEAAKPIWAWALKSDTSGAIAAMIRLARGAPGIVVEHEQLDADPWLLNCLNGTVDLRTGNLLDHDPADLCTLQAPVAYNPDAEAPLWEACLGRWQPDEMIRDYLQLRAGASATGNPTETVDIDYGGGGNGKSKFHGATQQVLGPYACVPHKSLLVAGRFEQHPTVVADLFRKRLALASETKQAEDLDDESVKNLTGGDRLQGRRMREDPWEFWPSHTLIMFSNHKPAVTGRDEGIWRRLRLVPWNATIPEGERDEQLAAKLATEASGILRWIVDGAVRFNRDGLNPPDAVRAATAAYRAEEDVIGRFIAECLQVDTTDTGLRNCWCYSSVIKAELDDWCAEQNIEVPRMNEVAATLRQRGCKDGGRKVIDGKRSTIWHGVDVAK